MLTYPTNLIYSERELDCCMKLHIRICNIVFVILLFLFFYRESNSQSYFINNYSIESGIPTRFISDATQDSKGRMWFATTSGISIYDGFRWINLSKKDGLKCNQYRKVKADKKGKIWCIPYYICEAVSYYENDSIKSIPSPIKRNNGDEFPITSFDIYYQNDSPVLCIGTTNGIFLYRNNNWILYNTDFGLKSNYIYNVTANENKFYISTKGGISVLDSGVFDNSLNDILDVKYLPILAVTFEKNENPVQGKKMWILGKNWVGWIQDKKLNILNDEFRLPTGKELEYSSLVLTDNNLIFFSNYYLSYFVNIITKELFPLTSKQGFFSDGCTTTFIDIEGNLWQTGTRGIDKVTNLCFMNYNQNNGLLENEVSAIIEAKPGEFIFGHNIGISILKEGKISVNRFPENKSGYPGDGRVMDMCKGKDGTVWLACADMGLGKIENGGSIKWIKFTDKANGANSVAADKNGVVWVGSNLGLYYVKDDRLIEDSDTRIKKFYYRRIFFNDDEGYFASSKGLMYKSGEKVKFYNVESNEKISNIYAVLRDDNIVYIGTIDGLYILKNDSLRKFDEKGFKIDNSVYSILKDKSGYIWFGTNDGVIKWDGKNEGIIYTKGNGLSGRETNRAALYQDSKGYIWIGTESGLTRHNPVFDYRTIPIPKVLLLNAEDASGDNYSLNQNSSLNYYNNTLRLDFRGISFYDEKHIKYRIKLEGFDADWYEVNQSQIDKIRYTNLVPGDYKLLVSAKNMSGSWSKVTESSVITIEKPFYKKLWFFIFIAAIIIIIIFLLNRLYIGRLYYLKMEKQVEERTAELREKEKALIKSQAELEEKVIERTSELATAYEQLKDINASKDKFFSIIAHDMKSPFTGLLGYTELLKNEAAVIDKDKIVEYSENLYKNLKSTYNLLENLLNWSILQTGKMSFNPEKVDLFLLVQGILEVLKTNYTSKNITLKNYVPINTSIRVDKNMIRTVLYNLISNGIKFTNRGGEVTIASENLNGLVEISISDNGVGIPKENLEQLFKLATNISTKGTEMEKGTGLGLLLCKEMIDIHKGKIFVESEVGKGTIFRVLISAG